MIAPFIMENNIVHDSISNKGMNLDDNGDISYVINGKNNNREILNTSNIQPSYPSYSHYTHYHTNSKIPKTIPMTKVSLGLACCRVNNNSRRNVPEMLLIKKRYTHAFSDFVHGKYEMTNNKKQLCDLFNKMTIDEKILILSLDFSHMWYKIWLSFEMNVTHVKAKNKFETSFLVTDKGEKLKKLIARSKSITIPWEIPKGRKKYKNESNLNCAIREFYEETHIAKRLYTIFLNGKKEISYVDNNVNYCQIYFIAATTCNFEPTVSLNDAGQISEVNEVQWMDIEKIRAVDSTGRLEKVARSVFNFVKKKMKEM